MAERSASARKECLAIAAPSFNAPSETFIRNHVRTVAPGQTILLCHDGTGTEAFDCPTLADIDPWHPPRTYGERIMSAVRHRWRVRVDPELRGASRRRVVAFLKAHNATAMLAQYGPMGCLLMSACRDAGIPLYVHFHGYDANILPQSRSVQKQYRRLFASCRQAIAASQFMKARLIALGCASEKVAVIPCGVNTKLFRPNHSATRDGPILLVSRLIAQKGPMLSLRSFAKVANQQRTIELEIIGDGPLKGELECEARMLGIGDRVHFHGAKPHEFVSARLSKARLLIQHCVSLPGQGVESFGLSILEAMACGLPVVATCHGAIPEAVEHGVTGLLVAEHDVDGMAEGMAELLADPGRAAAMGAAGRARVIERFTLDNTRDRLRALMGLPTLALAAATIA